MLNLSSRIFSKNRFTYIETITILLVLLFSGYLIDSADPLLLKTDIFFIAIPISVITLFYGIMNGLLSALVIAVIMFIFYGHTDNYILLKILLIVLILGKFHEMWSYALKICQEEKDLLLSRFNELGTRFYALKVSHDQLELNYILKPVSLRRALMEIVENHQVKESTFNAMLNLLAKTFNIQSMHVCTYANESCQIEASFGDNEVSSLDNDPLIRKAIEQASPVYISQHTSEETPYIAVIPIEIAGEIKAMLLIEAMPFMSFNEDNLISISFIFNFFYQTMNMVPIVESCKIMLEFEFNFRFEYIRLYHLEEKFDIDSSILIFKTRSKLASHRILETIKFSRRGLDTYTSIENNGLFLILIITPLSIASSANMLKERVIDNLEGIEKETFDVSIFNISQHDIAREFMELNDDR